MKIERQINAAIATLREPRGAWTVLVIAMALSATLILLTADGQTFGIDETFYLGRMVQDSGQIVVYPTAGVEYLLAPFNGHLELGGKLIYEAAFAAGAHYVVFVLINVLALCASVGLVFELARRRVGPLTALAPCVLLLFLGFAREVLLWPFNVHTLMALALGLAALLALQRDDRRGDVLACVLITLSIATIEVGLAILAGIAVSVLLRPDRLRRAWIFVVPAALYAAWWVWARRFEQNDSAVSISNLPDIPATAFEALAVVLGALTGTNPVIPESYNTEITWFGKGLAVVAIALLLARLWRGSIPRTLWVFLAVVLAYWGMMGLADRPPEGSRYVFVGAVGVLLVAAESARGRVYGWITGLVVVVALLALPANIAQLRSGHETDTLHRDAPVSRTEFAMLELAAHRVDPEYVATSDPRVVDAGGGLYFGIPAGAYLNRAQNDVSPAFSLDELRQQEERYRLLADATLVGAYGLELQPSQPPHAPAGCRRVAPQPGSPFATLPLEPGATRLRATRRRTALWLQRFADAPRSVGIAYLPRGRWTKLEIPRDDAPEAWNIAVDASVLACSGR